jgi:hypothetical protein
MEILALLEMCGCFLELAALFSSGGAAYSGYQFTHERKKARENEQPPASKFMWRFVVWLVIAAGLIVLVVSKWVVAIS